ncbi:hypothetical protein NDU88_010070 [Pleurodeles waltl]|uniref:Uncharacterized protein n=1 Tax=Pleurodeles waltl TaxID=8319 RepID=A0AAV7S079_PLEWA|nr:hypothetical protein NDU88_010070 [Pleurodeles waltl]
MSRHAGAAPLTWRFFLGSGRAGPPARGGPRPEHGPRLPGDPRRSPGSLRSHLEEPPVQSQPSRAYLVAAAIFSFGSVGLPRGHGVQDPRLLTAPSPPGDPRATRMSGAASFRSVGPH